MLLDPKAKPLSFRDYMTENMVSMAKSIKALDLRLDKDYVTRYSFGVHE